MPVFQTLCITESRMNLDDKHNQKHESALHYVSDVCAYKYLKLHAL